MKEVYHQRIPWMIVVIIIASSIACYRFFGGYWSSSSLIDLILANIFLLVTIVCIKPIIEWRKIEINDEYIVVHKAFFKPIKINITESLYQITMHNKDTYSFLFRSEDCYTQVSPIIYRNGINLSKRIEDHIRRNNLNIEVVS